MANFFQQILINRQTNRFSALVEDGEHEAALQQFGQRLSHYGVHVDKRVRATYHVLCWLLRGSQEDFNTLLSLAQDEPRDSQIVRAVQFAQRCTYETQLTEAVKKQSLSTLPASGKAYAPESEALATLGVEVLAAAQKSNLENEQRLAQSILHRLMTLEALHGGAESVRAYLIFWALWTLQRHADILHQLPLLATTPITDKVAFLRATIFVWGEKAIAQGQAGDASTAFAAARRLHDRGQLAHRMLATLPLRWALAGLNANQGEAVVDWLQQPDVASVVHEDPEVESLRLLLLALAQLAIDRHSHGRETLDTVLATSSAAPIQAQARYLQGVALLAETANWPLATGPDDHESTRVQHQAQWRKLRPLLARIKAALAQTDTTVRWRADLLEGLIAYVDSNVPLTIAQVERFAKACDFIPVDEGRSRLKAIEGVLLTRAKAIDEAIALVEARAFEPLQVLRNEVLDPLGDAIPGAVRAAVYMTLWEGNPAYDPWSDLQQISVSAENEPETAALIDQCAAQVQFVSTLKALTRLCRQPLVPEARSLSSLIPLTPVPSIAAMGALAKSIVHLHQGHWQEALTSLGVEPDQEESEDALVDGVHLTRFYAAWKLGDVDQCAALASEQLLDRYTGWQAALRIRQLLAAVERQDEVEAAGHLARIIDEHGYERSIPGLSMRLVEHNPPADASFFFNIVRGAFANRDSKRQDDAATVNWWLPFFVGLTAARLQQYTRATEAFNECIAAPIPTSIHPDDGRRLVGLAKVFGLQAELAIVSESQDNLKVRWPAVRRALTEKARQINETPGLQAYGFLVMGLVSYLTEDMFVDQETISKLRHAQRVLRLNRHASFLERVIARLSWRQRVLIDFWAGLQRGDFQQSRSIFLREIQPVFGDRIPDPIQLGMLLVDWDAGTHETPALLRRLEILEHESPELNPDTIEQVRKYMIEGERIRQFTRLVHEEAYDEIIEFVGSSDWAESMPVPVAISLLHALYRKKKHDDAQRFGHAITDTPNLARRNDAGTHETPALLRRLEILEHESPELNPDTIEQVRKYMIEGERIRQFTRLVHEEAYDEIIEFVGSSDWAESMPVPVAISLLHALYRKKKHDDAQRFGHAITDTPNLARWVHDYGYFILGYLRFDNKDYEEAAKAFEKISVPELLDKHNTDRYWAMTHFSRGLQYLENENKTREAFDSFRRSLGQREASAENVSLIPLFTYFGLQNLKRGNGNQALQAFTLLKASLEGVGDSDEAAQGALLAEMGQLLCRALLPDPEGGIPSGDEFLPLWETWSYDDQKVSPQKVEGIERTLRIMTLVQKLRRHHTLSDLRRLKDDVMTQAAALEDLPSPQGGQDPVLMVLQALIHLHFHKPTDPRKALELLINASRLGLHSRMVAALINELTQAIEGKAKAELDLLDLFDAYLTSGTVPTELRAALNQNEKLTGLYRAGRSYTQIELRSPPTVPPDQIVAQRIATLCEKTKEMDLQDENVNKWLTFLDDELGQFKESYKKLAEIEQKLIEALTSGIELQAQ